jgi:hypothetical protein
MQTTRGYFCLQEIQGSVILHDYLCFVLGYLCLFLVVTNNFLRTGCESRVSM